MKILYLAKEPDQGVKSDLAELSQLGEVTVVACNPGYVDFYKKIGYNIISKGVFFDGLDMQFDVIIGNPPYQDPTNPAANNKLWHKFVTQSLGLVSAGGKIKLVTPSSIIGDTGFGNNNTNYHNINNYEASQGEEFRRGLYFLCARLLWGCATKKKLLPRLASSSRSAARDPPPVRDPPVTHPRPTRILGASWASSGCS